MRRRWGLAIVLGIVFASAALPARAELPSVARARYSGPLGLARGTVFFLETPSGPVAVGAAHSFDAAKLAATSELVFELGRTRERASDARRMLTPLGIGFAEAGGSLRSDFVVFALDAPPAGVLALRAATERARGDVRVLGIPAAVPDDQESVEGGVEEATDEKLEIELDRAHDLRGWGGAPVVSRDGRVVGIVQAAQPSGKTMRVLATPITAVLDSLRLPLDGGRGRAFAALAPEAPVVDSAPAPGIAARPAKKQPLIPQLGPQRPVTLTVDHPNEGTIVGGRDAIAFVAGRAMVARSEGLTTDVMFVIDVSGSTAAPSGADVNGNGVVGAAPLGAPGGLYALGADDPGDSILAAEIAAVRRLMSRLDPRYTRTGLAAFSGQMLAHGVLAEHPAVTEMALTTKYEDVQRALDRVFARGPGGATYMAAGVVQATAEVNGERGAFSQGNPQSQKVIVFLTDGIPTLPFEGDDPRNTVAVVRAAERARAAGARVFSFGVGEEALAGPLALLELARITDGAFTPVRDPALLSDVFAEVEFADIADLRVRNATMDAPAQVSELGPDGSFGSFVPLRAGRNAIEVTARSSDGRSAKRTVNVEYAPDAAVAALPPDLLAIQNKLLEIRLAQLRRDRIGGEQQRIDALRAQLAEQIERERRQAAERAVQQQKRLDVEVDREGGGEPGAVP